MKRIILSSLGMLMALTCVLSRAHAQQVQPLPVDPQVRVGKLDNGLTYYIRHNELPKQRAEFHIAQAVGAILEEDNQNGLAHFLEHMAFNGTEHFHGKGIINYFESIGVNFGGNINAYTALDETVYRLSDVPTIREGIIDSALLVMHDWSHSLLLEAEEIDAERGVILEEWRTRAGAERRMWKELNPQIYPGSQYAKRDVIGDTAVILHFDYQALRDYYHKWYGPDLQAIVVVGDIDVDQIEQKIKALWADVPARENRGERPIYGIEKNEEPIVGIVKDKEAQVSRICVYFKQDGISDQLKNTTIDYSRDVYINLLCNIVNQRLSEKAQKPDATFIGAGFGYGNIVKEKEAFYGIIIPKEGKEIDAYKDLLKEIETLRRYGVTESELAQATKAMLSSYERSYNERNNTYNITLTREYIRNFLDGESIPGIEWEYEFVKQLLPQITAARLTEYAKMVLIHDNDVIISVTAPEKDNVVIPSKEELAQMFIDKKNYEIEAPVEEVINTTLVQKAPKAGKIKKVTRNSSLGTTEWLLKNGIRVIFKPTEFKQDQILMSAYSEGGTSLLSDPKMLKATTEAVDIIEMSGLGDMNATQLQKALTGKQVSISPSIGTYSEGLSGSSSVKDLETLLQLNYLYFTAPRKDAEAFETLKAMLETSLKNKETNHKAVFRDSVTMMATNYSPRALIFNVEDIEYLDLDLSYNFFRERFADPADFTYTFVGNINPDDPQTRQLILTWLGGMKTGKCKKQKEHWQDTKVRVPEGVNKNYFDRRMQITTATNRIQYTSYNIPYTLENSLNMQMIGRILSTRYLESIREREGGSYGVSCWGSLSRIPLSCATLSMQFDTDPDKQERLMQIIHEEVDEILKNGPRADDLQKEKESMLKDYDENIETNSYWRGTVLPQYYRVGIDYTEEYKTAVSNITAESVRLILRRLVDAGNMFEVVMTPSR